MTAVPASLVKAAFAQWEVVTQETQNLSTAENKCLIL